MTDLLVRRLPRRIRPDTPLSPPPLAEPKSLFRAIRSMTADGAFTANLSRAVVQFVRHFELQARVVEAGDFDERHVEWKADDVRSGPGGSEEIISCVRAPAAARRRSFLDRARRLDERGQTDSALDLIFDQIDELLLARHFDNVNQLLKDAVANDYSAEMLLGVLTATLPAKDRLPNRRDFFQRASQVLESRGEHQDSLLVGLE